MQIDVVRPGELTASQIARWCELQETQATWDSPFLSPHWARAVERAQGSDTRGAHVAVVSGDNGPDGFMAARVGVYTAMPVGSPMCDYQALVAAPDLKVDPREIVQAFGVHRFDFSHMLPHSPFSEFGRGEGYSHIVDVRQGYASYEAERRESGTSVLKDTDKKRRKVEREVGPATFTAYSRSRADFDKLMGWKRAQLAATGQTDIFETGWTRRLVQELFESRDPDFGGALFTLHFGDRLAAVHLHLRGRRTIHGWMIAHDPEFERYSPGLILFQDILRWMDDTPYSRLDLGPGDYRFKRELANAGQGVTHGFVGLPSPASLMRSAAYGVVKAAEALPLGKASDLPAKALRRMDQWRGLRAG